MDKEVLSYLDKLNIDYEVVSHPAALTTEEADKYIEGIDGIRSKTLFLSDQKKRRFYLVILDDKKNIDMNSLALIAGEKRLKFASAESLKTKLNLEPGIVSIFGLLYNQDIKVYIDKEIINENRISFHPNVNTKTIFISVKDMFKFLKNLDINYEIINL